jgi:hypothetical protein
MYKLVEISIFVNDVRIFILIEYEAHRESHSELRNNLYRRHCPPKEHYDSSVPYSAARTHLAKMSH